MTGLIAILILALLAVIAVQIGKVSDLAASIRGNEDLEDSTNKATGIWLLVFMVVFLIGTIVSAWYYKNSMLGYGPLTSASEHGFWIDGLFNTTLIFTFIVFFITHVLLFWYAYKFRNRAGRKAKFMAHNNTLELVWTVVPVIIMTFLVVKGIIAWNEIMPDLGVDDEYVEIEATGYQFGWDIRYPGPDGILGTKDYRLINQATNSLGMDWTDVKSQDDIILSGADQIVLPVDTTVRVRITSKDVLHNFYLPHFRVKMDAIPGLPTYFIFRPTKTTSEFRKQLKKYPEWNVPTDPEDPESNPRWKDFEYELACAELCGIGHYSMRRVVKIVSKDEYEEWKVTQKSFYLTNVVKETKPEKISQVVDSVIEELTH
ncbi:MAG: cytochrome c oxidase subunit II [Saprospiraceae bacterium]